MDSYQEILDRMKAKYKELSGYEADGASDIGIRMQVLAGEVFSLSCYAQWIIRQMFPQTAQGEQLDYHALEQGLTRKPAIAAKGTLSFYLEEAAKNWNCWLKTASHLKRFPASHLPLRFLPMPVFR